MGQFGARVKFRKEVNMKKMLFVVALVALMVPATFARTYLHSDGNWTGNFGGQQTGTDDAGNPIYAPGASNPDREIDDSNFEIKAESYNWPASYDYVTAATITVRMEVGFWIKLATKDKVLNLKQVEIHSYAGNVTIPVSNNVNISIQASFAKKTYTPALVFDVETLDLNGTGDTTTINAPGGNLKITMKIKNVDLSLNASLVAGTCQEIGTLTLKVKPLVKPNVTGGSC
jgi:hypothetical protein